MFRGLPYITVQRRTSTYILIYIRMTQDVPVSLRISSYISVHRHTFIKLHDYALLQTLDPHCYTHLCVYIYVPLHLCYRYHISSYTLDGRRAKRGAKGLVIRNYKKEKFASEVWERKSVGKPGKVWNYKEL